MRKGSTREPTVRHSTCRYIYESTHQNVGTSYPEHCGSKSSRAVSNPDDVAPPDDHLPSEPPEEVLYWQERS